MNNSLPYENSRLQGSGEHYVDLVSVPGGYTATPSGYMPPRAEISGGIDVFTLLRRYWLLLFLLMILGAAAGVVAVIYQSPVFRARVLLEVQGINEAWLKNSFDSSSSFNSDEINIQTQIHLLRGGPFLQRVFQRLQSETVPLTP